MFVCMSGWPYSGKSVFVKMLIPELKALNHKIILLDPTEAYPDNIDTLPADQKSAFAIAAWEVVLEEAMRAVCGVDNKHIIILDTTGSNSNALGPIIDRAALRNHKTLFIKITAPLEECKRRAGERWLNREAEDKYKDRFNSNVNFLENICHNSVEIDNSVRDNLTNMSHYAKKIARMIHRQVDE